mmetsp:Transcript_10683/g.34124  ORF Transcript_10683/g.34124 Transcript_10683/m.34124 type:complete len:173 (+) Transcript_10683:902-1420(+)
MEAMTAVQRDAGRLEKWIRADGAILWAVAAGADKAVRVTLCLTSVATARVAAFKPPFANKARPLDTGSPSAQGCEGRDRPAAVPATPVRVRAGALRLSPTHCTGFAGGWCRAADALGPHVARLAFRALSEGASRLMVRFAGNGAAPGCRASPFCVKDQSAGTLKAHAMRAAA